MGKQDIAVTTDCVIFCNTSQGLKLLLVQRKHEPFKGMWALPGGFLKEHETLEAGAKRELEEETGLKVKAMNQLKAFGTPGRDPRGRTISITFWTEVAFEDNVMGNDDAADAKWVKFDDLPKLAFDHDQIVKEAKKQYLSHTS